MKISKQWTARERLLAIEILAAKNLKALAAGNPAMDNIAMVENSIFRLATSTPLGLEAHRAEIERDMEESK